MRAYRDVRNNLPKKRGRKKQGTKIQTYKGAVLPDDPNVKVDYKLLANNVDFVVIELGFGSVHVNPKLKDHFWGCFDYDIPILGFYHTIGADTIDAAVADVKHIRKQIDRLSEVLTKPFVAIEWSSESEEYIESYGKHVSSTMLTQIIKTMYRTLTDYEAIPCIVFNFNDLGNKLANDLRHITLRKWAFNSFIQYPFLYYVI